MIFFYSSTVQENGNILGASPQTHMQFAHSTPNHNAAAITNCSTKTVHMSTAKPQGSYIFFSFLNCLYLSILCHKSGLETNKNEQISKKQLLVKEIAVNILELNGYKTRTEQLDNELKNYNKLKNEINMNQSSRDFLSISEKTEVFYRFSLKMTKLLFFLMRNWF